MNRIIITKMKPEQGREFLFTCLLSGNRLMRVSAEDPMGDEAALGSIVIGKVSRVIKGIGAAFVEIRPGVMCYYPLNGKESPFYVRKAHDGSLRAGDEILVQISREAMKTKEAAVSSNLNFTGRYLVLTSENRQVNVSSRLNHEKKEHYRKLFAGLGDRDFGLIVRTNAAEVSDETVLAECEALRETYHRILEAAPNRVCFSRLYAGEAPWKKFLKGARPEDLEEIVTDDPALYEEIAAFCRCYPDYRAVKIRLYEDPMVSLAKVWNLEKELQRALQRKVWLKSGGYLVIDPTEALTAIDVNSGKSLGKKHRKEHMKKINYEAADEIARQMQLRNLSGMILVDFINMDSRSEEEELLTYFRKAVKGDPIPVQVLDYTRLGLVEITRKKVMKSLKEQLTK